VASIPPDVWKMKLDRSHDPRREPGPINLQRYAFVPAYAGIATFFGVPLCLNQDDLRAGHVDVAVLGAPVDMDSMEQPAGSARLSTPRRAGSGPVRFRRDCGRSQPGSPDPARCPLRCGHYQRG
jgi:hypothetical protein